VLKLAPDPAVPHRDALLNPEIVAGLFPRATACDRVDAKYRVGESLRVVYRLDGVHHVAARTFADGRSAGAYQRARARSVPAGPLPAVLHVPELDAVFWAFPNDRRLGTLTLLADGSPALSELIGRPCARVRLVAYHAERSASARCLDESGRAVAYVKILAGGGAEHERRQLEAAGPLAPRVIGSSTAHGALALAPLEGRRLDTLRGADLAAGLEGFGRTLAALHRTCPLPEQPFTRLAPERLARAAAVIARARPDAADAAALVLDGLRARSSAASGSAVCLHGDATVRNAISDGRRVTLLDLEHAAAGPGAADLGHVLAGLVADRVLGRISVSEGRALAAAFVAGYAAVAPPPDADSLRWYADASLLARIANSAINRVRPDLLRRLGPLLDTAIP
jgi:aminoglycoside phosphotransferase